VRVAAESRSALADARCDDAQIVGETCSGKLLDLCCDRRDNFRWGLSSERLDNLGEPRLAELLSVMARFGYAVGVQQDAGAGPEVGSRCCAGQLL
jgi:hypothetical protein